MAAPDPALTRRQQEILDFLREHATGFARPPTLDELAAVLGMRSRGSLHKQVQALIDAGLVEPMNRTRRGVRLTRAATVHDGSLPLLGRIAAGRPIEAIADDARMDVPANLRTRDDCYVLQVRGDSMIEDGILDGDWIVVEPRDSASNGQVVVALVDGSEATVKRLLQRPGEVVLIPANGSMAPMHLAPDRVSIQGVVVGQMRSYR
jgi:repressor LexA